MRLTSLLLAALVAAAAVGCARGDDMPGSSCVSVSPDSQAECCQTKADSNDDSDSWCLEQYPDLFTPLGASCSTVTPGDNKKCCKKKAKAGDNSDSWCLENYPQLFLVGSSCGTVSPDSREECCQTKVNEGTDDTWCDDNYPDLTPIDGSSCGTVSPDSREQCCQTKVNEGTDDTWCDDNYPDLTPILGSSCGTVSPDSREECCQTKVNEGTDDTWCDDNYPDLTPILGSSCGTVSPDSREECCQTKVNEGTDDSYCCDNYGSLYPDGSDCNPGSGNTGDYPWMAYIESPAAANGSCAGSLVAPGYVLTAAQCVFKDGQAVDAADVKVWVDGKQYTVETVLVNQDNAQFSEFTNPKSQPSWDVAMLALTEDSDAQYVALPLSAGPAFGDWVTTTAWKKAKTDVETAELPVWNGCDQGWTDDFCIGGSGFLQACPDDKGAPVIKSNTQIGFASGPGCTGESSDWGWFLNLSDKGVLEQITVWLNSRGTTGLDDNIQSWLQDANTYLYGK